MIRGRRGRETAAGNAKADRMEEAATGFASTVFRSL